MFTTEIQIKGKLDQNWSDWFEPLRVQESPSGDTVLCGTLPDRSAVYGVISRLSSLGVTLISVTCREERETGPPEEKAAIENRCFAVLDQDDLEEKKT